MKTLIFLIVLLGLSTTHGALETTSPVKPKGISIESPEGFLLKDLNTAWFQSPPPPSKKGIHMLFRAPKAVDGFQALLTIRVDKDVEKAKSIKQYVRQWMGDYKKLGYKVLGSKAFKQDGNPAYVIDVQNKKTKKQVRQVVFFKPEKAVVITCIDNEKSFTKSLPECNRVTKSFAWNK